MVNKLWERLRNNFSLKLIALGIAAVIWLLVTNSNDPTHSILINNVAINIVNEDLIEDIGKVVEPEGSGTVTLRVTERNSILRKLARNGSDFYVEANLENITDLNTIPLTVTSSNPAITWDEISIQPSSLKVNLEDKVEQAFAVTVVASGNPGNGYAVGRTQVLDGKNILIAGPKSLIGIINQVIAPVSVSGLSADSTFTSILRVMDKNGAELTESQMSRLEFKDSTGNVLADRRVSVGIELWKVFSEVPIRVATVGTPAEGYFITQITTIPQTVTLIGTDEALAQIGGILTVADALNVEGATGNVSAELDIAETLNQYEELKLPADADTAISAQAQIEKSGDKRLEIPMSDVFLLNRPMDMKLVFTPADLLPVVVHSENEEEAPIGRIRSENVTVSLDLSECEEEGNYDITATVNLPEGYALSQDVTVAVTSLSSTDTGAADTYISSAGSVTFETEEE